MFQKVEIRDPSLVYQTEQGLHQYGEFAFMPAGDIESGDCILFREGHQSIHVKPYELEELYTPNDDEHWEANLVKVKEKGFDYALYHMRSGLPVERNGKIYLLMDGKLMRKIKEGYYLPWTPLPEDLLAEDWQVSIGELQ